MTQMTLTFDAVAEATPGPKWAARWNRSWPAYEAWFIARGGDSGPSRAACRDAMKRYMPELVSTYDRLLSQADRTARRGSCRHGARLRILAGALLPLSPAKRTSGWCATMIYHRS